MYNGWTTVPSFSLKASQRIDCRALLSTQRSNDNEDKTRTRLSQAAGVGGAMAILWGKGKWFLAAAKLTKFTSLISMLASTAAYALFFGWPFAIGLVGQIALHESVRFLFSLRIETLLMFVCRDTRWQCEL